MVFEAGGNPYGVSNASGGESATASEAEPAAARYQGRRLAEVTGKLVAGRSGDTGAAPAHRGGAGPGRG